jgi:hypothetical protein
MTGDTVGGFLEVGLNDANEIIINHPDLKPDENGIGHIVFSPAQARHLAQLLTRHAATAENTLLTRMEQEMRERAAAIPVDRSARTMLDGSPVTSGHREINPFTGMQKDYVVLSAGERAKGFVRPLRSSYRHNACGAVTTMGRALSETYARDPEFYTGTFCVTCRAHFPLQEFVWTDDGKVVGS